VTVGDTVQVEPHPWFHDLEVKGDYVHEEGRRGRVLVIRRVEECKACNTIRTTLIDAQTWTVRSRRYSNRTTVVRMPRSEYLKAEFRRTTTWAPEILHKLGFDR
jgi:hypothetical protein